MVWGPQDGATGHPGIEEQWVVSRASRGGFLRVVILFSGVRQMGGCASASEHRIVMNR